MFWFLICPDLLASGNVCEAIWNWWQHLPSCQPSISKNLQHRQASDRLAADVPCFGINIRNLQWAAAADDVMMPFSMHPFASFSVAGSMALQPNGLPNTSHTPWKTTCASWRSVWFGCWPDHGYCRRVSNLDDCVTYNVLQLMLDSKAHWHVETDNCWNCKGSLYMPFHWGHQHFSFGRGSLKKANQPRRAYPWRHGE